MYFQFLRSICIGLLCLVSAAGVAAPISYHALVVTDAEVNGTLYHFVTVRIDFVTDTRNVYAVPTGWRNDVGSTRLSLDLGNRTIVAHVSTNRQVYAQLDRTNGNVGFGSVTGGPAYPLILTLAQGGNGGDSLLQTVQDIGATPADAVNYSPAAQALVNDLKHATVLSGTGLSCTGSFNPVTSTCGNLTPIALNTDAGPIYLSSPYLDYGIGGIGANVPYSMNWGMFWIDMTNSGD